MEGGSSIVSFLLRGYALIISENGRNQRKSDRKGEETRQTPRALLSLSRRVISPFPLGAAHCEELSIMHQRRAAGLQCVRMHICLFRVCLRRERVCASLLHKLKCNLKNSRRAICAITGNECDLMNLICEAIFRL